MLKTVRRRAVGASLVLPIMLASCATTSDANDITANNSAAVDVAQTNRPNVLFILVDDLRPDLGIYGNPVAQTPNLDALGRSGIVFDNAITQQAVCGPSRAALMTGFRPDTSGIKDLKTPVDEALPDAVTILDLFKANGYQTLGYGKIYHDRADDMDGWTKRTEDQEHVQRQAAQRARRPKLAADAVTDRASLPDTQNVQMAIDDLKRLGKTGEPFFMAVGIHRPHLPFVSPKSDWDRYDRSKIPGPVNPNGQKGVPPWAVVAYEVWNYDDTKAYEASKKMPDEKVAQLRHAYLAAVSYADSLVGDLMRELKAQGLDDNTIVVVWGDHGWKLGDQAGWAKHSNVNLDIHIPLMVVAPGKTLAGTRSEAMVETVDIYPTLAELAGLTPPSNIEGISMVPLFDWPEQAWKTAAFAQFNRNIPGHGNGMGYTVRTQSFRYTAWLGSKGEMVAQELYDLRVDPTESTNVAREAAYRDDVKRLEKLRQDGWKAALPGK